MTSLAPKPRHEPEERDDPRNALLDAAEELIRRCVEHGLGPQIEARLAKLFPKPAASASGRRSSAESDALTEELWEDSVILTALAEARAKIKSPASVKLIDTAHGFAKARFDRAKSSKGQPA